LTAEFRRPLKIADTQKHRARDRLLVHEAFSGSSLSSAESFEWRFDMFVRQIYL
jgi:hypothetical protein